MNDGKTTQVNVRLSADETQRLAEIAASVGMSKSDFLRSCITAGGGKVKPAVSVETLDRKSQAIYQRAARNEKMLESIVTLMNVIVIEVFVGVGVILIFK